MRLFFESLASEIQFCHKRRNLRVAVIHTAAALSRGFVGISVISVKSKPDSPDNRDEEPHRRHHQGTAFSILQRIVSLGDFDFGLVPLPSLPIPVPMAN